VNHAVLFARNRAALCSTCAMTITEVLPNDAVTLKAMLIAERARSERQEQIIRAFKRHRFGRHSEQLSDEQLQFCLEDIEQADATRDAAEEHADPAKKVSRATGRRRNRGALPTHLPRIETIVDVADRHCPYCHGEMHQIGEDVSERLDVIPAQFRVIVTRRPKYACRSCESVVVHPLYADALEGADAVRR
jgi:transposase